MLFSQLAADRPARFANGADNAVERGIGTLLGFLEGVYEAAAGELGWDRAELASSWCPTPRS